MAESVTINFLGDIYLGEQPYLSITPEISHTLKSADLVIANQEGPITDQGRAIGGKCCLKSAPETANILQNWGVDVVSLANNHMFDYGWEGFEQTRLQLDKAGIRYLGAGKDLQEASSPLIADVKGTRIGLIAYSWEFVQTTCASENSYGCAPLDKELMVKQIDEIKSHVDSVIVLPHWGYCDYRIPTPMEVNLGKCLIKAGATAVVGSHSHTIQGIARSDDAIIAYNLGDFAFGENWDQGRFVRIQDRTRDSREGMILKLHILPKKVESYEVVYTVLRNNGLIEIDDSPRRREEFAKRSSILSAQDYFRPWQRYVRLRLVKRFLYWMNVLNWHKIRKGTLAGGWLAIKNSLFRKK